MKQPPTHSWVEISERALMHNIRAHRRLLNRETKLMAVVKSNAYGHGLELVARVCQRSHQVDWLGVASLEEARQLRHAEISLPILVLSYYRPLIPTDLAWGVSHHVSFIVYEPEQLKALARAARLVGKPAHVQVKFETGMARLGVMPKDATNFIKQIIQSPYLKLEGLATHFATAESRDKKFLNKQLQSFQAILDELGTLLPPQLLKHLACTAAITAAPHTHESLVRLGIGLYGLWPSEENKTEVRKTLPNLSLRPSLTWKTQVIDVQQLPTNTPIGYDCTYVTKRPTTMAVIPVGYWDGFDRKLSNQGHVLIHGKRCPILGKICMNISMVDVTQLQNVNPGDEVVIIGRQKWGSGSNKIESEITAEMLAADIGTINYEAVTRINPLLPRLLV